MPMQGLRMVVLSAALVMCNLDARADILSASCSNIHGLRMDDDGKVIETNTDGLTGATWAYSWDTKTTSATLILQSTRGHRTDH